jgi:hypothetical protein
MSTHVFLTAATLLAVSGLAVCGDPPKDDPDIAKLVRDLGSPKFAVREAAEQKLVALGYKAKAAVLAGTKDPDAEVAGRCEVVLPKVRAAERKALVEGTIDWPAPAGTHFRDLVGDTAEARKLFLLMIEDDRRARLVDEAAGDRTQAAKLYVTERARLVAVPMKAPDGILLPPGTADREAVMAFVRDAHREAVGPADVTLALYLGSFDLPTGARDPADVARLLRTSFFDLATGPQKVPFARLFSAWLAHRRDPDAVQTGLTAALFAHIAEAAPVARRLAADPKAPGPAAGTAVLVLGHLGSKDDRARLSALRDDERVFKVHWGDGVAIDLQVRDLATAMSLVLRGEALTNFGFEPVEHRSWWTDSAAKPFTTPEVFQSPEARTAVLQKAWDWLDRQPGAPPKPAKSGR